MDSFDNYLEFTSLEDELEIIHLIQEIVDLDQVSEFLIFCGFSHEEIIDKAEAYLKVAL